MMQGKETTTRIEKFICTTHQLGINSMICTCMLSISLKVIYKGCFKSFVALYADRICSDQHFVENRIEKFLFV